ncbi:MAG TPA: hypothetical protein VGF46_03640 [Gaiellales bacterium]|jgi:hypothetical protein
MAALVKTPAATAKNLRDEVRRSAVRAGVIAFIALTLGGVLEHSSVVIAIGLTLGGLIVCAVFALVAIRANRIRRRLPGECRQVLAVGWTREPDGSNYALFRSGREGAEPDLVLRLTTSRQVGTSRALLLGASDEQRTTALLTGDGGILAIGTLRRPESARRAWARRDEPRPWWAAAFTRKTPPADG